LRDYYTRIGFASVLPELVECGLDVDGEAEIAMCEAEIDEEHYEGNDDGSGGTPTTIQRSRRSLEHCNVLPLQLQFEEQNGPINKGHERKVNIRKVRCFL
jgi:hypothetical protein